MTKGEPVERQCVNASLMCVCGQSNTLSLNSTRKVDITAPKGQTIFTVTTIDVQPASYNALLLKPPVTDLPCRRPSG